MAGHWRPRLGAEARQDLDAIIRWTARQFGARQAETYAQMIRAAIVELRSGPEVPGSRARDDVMVGVRTLHVARHGRRGRHVLLYQVSGERRIVVGRILHDSMDLAAHLPRSQAGDSDEA